MNVTDKVVDTAPVIASESRRNGENKKESTHKLSLKTNKNNNEDGDER